MLKVFTTGSAKIEAPLAEASERDSARTASSGAPPDNGETVNIEKDLLTLVDETLHLEGRSSTFTRNTPLMGAVPELDSMGVVALITAFEDRLGLSVDDDEIDGAVFQTWGTLLDFVQGKLSA